LQTLSRTTALGIGGERRKELCAVERSTEANAEPRKARPPPTITVKNYLFFAVMVGGGNAQIKKGKHLSLPEQIIKKAFSLS